MADITAAMVKALRDRTKLPMMKCKEALKTTDGDIDAAIEYMRKEGEKFNVSRAGRETSQGRIESYSSLDEGVGALIELQCESAQVANTEDFRKLAADLVNQLAKGSGAASPDELLAQPSPSKEGLTLADQLSELTGQIREVFRLARILRIDASCGGYVHFDGSKAALVEVEGGNQELAKEIGMQIVATRPDVVAIADLDPAVVAKEREILGAAARTEGKPENIIEKMVEGRLRNFYAERVLNEQPFVKDDSKTVSKLAEENGMKIIRFQNWELGGS